MISGLFKGAAREAQRVLEDADPSQADKLRAAYTLLQSLFELNRFPPTPLRAPPTLALVPSPPFLLRTPPQRPACPMHSLHEVCTVVLAAGSAMSGRCWSAHTLARACH